jgi:hypothetical protein
MPTYFGATDMTDPTLKSLCPHKLQQDCTLNTCEFPFYEHITSLHSSHFITTCILYISVIALESLQVVALASLHMVAPALIKHHFVNVQFPVEQN